MIRKLFKLLLLSMLPLIPAGEVAYGDGATRENQLKAAFVFNFAQFVEWPREAFVDASSPLVVGVLGDAGFGGMLEQAVKGKTAGKREIVVRIYSSANAVQRCHILFIGGSAREAVGEVVKKATGENTLTIGDFEGFTAAFGMVRFLTEDNRLRFEVNLDATNEGRLKLSSQLLKLARMYQK